jgi:hypothetical protein
LTKMRKKRMAMEDKGAVSFWESLLELFDFRIRWQADRSRRQSWEWKLEEKVRNIYSRQSC